MIDTFNAGARESNMEEVGREHLVMVVDEFSKVAQGEPSRNALANDVLASWSDPQEQAQEVMSKLEKKQLIEPPPKRSDKLCFASRQNPMRAALVAELKELAQ